MSALNAGRGRSHYLRTRGSRSRGEGVRLTDDLPALGASLVMDCSRVSPIC